MAWLAKAEAASNGHVSRPPSWQSPLVVLVLRPQLKKSISAVPARKHHKVKCPAPTTSLPSSGTGWKRPIRAGGGDTKRVVGRAFNSLSTVSTDSDIAKAMQNIKDLDATKLSEAVACRAIAQGHFATMYERAYAELLTQVKERDAFVDGTITQLCSANESYNDSSVTKEQVSGYAKFIEAVQRSSGKKNVLIPQLQQLSSKPITLSYVILNLNSPSSLKQCKPLIKCLQTEHRDARTASLLRSACAAILE